MPQQTTSGSQSFVPSPDRGLHGRILGVSGGRTEDSSEDTEEGDLGGSVGGVHEGGADGDGCTGSSKSLTNTEKGGVQHEHGAGESVEPVVNVDDYLDYHLTICADARVLSLRKNRDYTGSDDQPFANFQRCESMGITTTEKGFLVRLTDKFSRLSTFCETGSFQVEDESFRDTLIDIINYTCLMGAYVQSKKDTNGG